MSQDAFECPRPHKSKELRCLHSCGVHVLCDSHPVALMRLYASVSPNTQEQNFSNASQSIAGTPLSTRVSRSRHHGHPLGTRSKESKLLRATSSRKYVPRIQSSSAPNRTGKLKPDDPRHVSGNEVGKINPNAQSTLLKAIRHRNRH